MSYLKRYSRQRVVRTRNREVILFFCFSDWPPKFSQELAGFARLSSTILGVTLPDLLLETGIAKFQIIFQIVYVHDANDRNAVFFKDEVLPVNVRSADNLAEVDAGSSERNSMDYAFHD
jgi:hypothetical protein